MSAGIPISPNADIKSSELKGLAEIPNSSAYLTPTTSYQTLVSAPASGVRRVNQIVLKNIDASVTTVFSFKLVRSGTDYVVVQFQLAPGEKFVLTFQWLLTSADSIEAKVAASCSGLIEAGYVTWLGGMDVANFTGTSWADVLTVPAGKIYSMLGVVIQNSYTNTQAVSLQVLNGSSAVMYSDARTLAPGGVWFVGLPMVLGSGWKVQVKHGAASYTGSAVASWIEVP